MKTAIVIPTINIPTLLNGYVADILAHPGDEVSFFVIGDEKTPIEAEAFCIGLARTSNLDIRYITLEQQINFMAFYKNLEKFIPWNSVQRRNIGHLIAYVEGFETIIALDDDNFLSTDNYINWHNESLTLTSSKDCVSSPDKWYNCCTQLHDLNGRLFFPRGYPMRPRVISAPPKHHALLRHVVVNAGLWLGDPDIDAVTRLAHPIDVKRYYGEQPRTLIDGTWCPFNSQNTAINRKVLPAWFMSPHIGRFDDIWASYIVQACAHALGDSIAFGQPLVKQNRNQHDLWADLELEKLGMQLTDRFCEVLRAEELNGDTYASCAWQLITAVDIWAHNELKEPYQNRVKLFCEGYREWLNTFEYRG